MRSDRWPRLTEVGPRALVVDTHAIVTAFRALGEEGRVAPQKGTSIDGAATEQGALSPELRAVRSVGGAVKQLSLQLAVELSIGADARCALCSCVGPR